MRDPYGPLSVHGLWPLVADPSAPGGVRFAEPDRDAPSDCLTSPDGLPDLGFEIRAFPNPHVRDGWCAAAREFGGNAVHVSALPVDAIPAALVIRFDRARAPGSTLEKCVPLVGAVPAGVAETRGRSWIDRRRAARDTAWRTAWAPELAVLGDVRGLRLDHARAGDPARLALTVEGGGPLRAVLLEPVRGGRRVSFEPAEGSGLGEPDLDAAFRAVAEGLGYAPGKLVPIADRGALEGVLADVEALDAAHRRLRDRALRRGEARLATQGEAGEILARLAAGFPVAKAASTSGRAYQVDPGTGRAVEIDEAAIRALWKARAVRPAWWRARVRTYNDHRPLDAFDAGVWVASDLGRDLASGAADPAAAEPRMARERALSWRAVYGPDASPAFEGIAGTAGSRWHVPEGAAAADPAAIHAARPDARALAVLAARTAHGLAVTPDADGVSAPSASRAP